MENGYLDTQFDAGFRDLRWLPWVGSEYRTSAQRTIVLGESIYDYSKGVAAKRAQIEARSSLRERQLVHGIHETCVSKYLRNFAKAFYLKHGVNKAEREALWRQMVYHNLVLRMMKSAKHRPGKRDYLEGWQTFLSLARQLEARRCVVYGLDPLKLAALKEALTLDAGVTVVERKRLSEIGRSRPLRIVLNLDGRPLDMLFIRHPSAYFSWDEWGVVLRQFLGVQ